jgi:hypothetical protein
MVLADAERVETDLIGENRLFDHVAQHARLRLAVPVCRDGDVAERVHTDLECVCHPGPSLS